ncbi:MAG: TonB family protein, partial [Deltaproteobacteria bacterium]|nr:TonB family protein [Deltaproteobacteria bacterium]
MRRLCTLSLALLVASGPSWAQTPPADAPKDEQPAPPADAPKDEQPAPPAGGQSPASPAQPGPGQPPASGVVPPTLKKDSQPTYPKGALDKRIEAVVVLDIDITPEGFVDSASVVKVEAKNEDGSDIDATGLGFDDAATVAALGLEFNPATDSGKPIPVRVTYTYRFKLPAKPQPTPTPQPPPPPPPPQPAKQPVANFTGVMVERGTRSFVPAATVTVYRGEGENAEGFEATTDDQGKFVFYDLEPGEWNVRATIDGYIPFKTRETITVGEAIDVKYYIERGSYNPYDVTIEAERPKKEVNRRSLRKADIERIPGTLGDPVLVIENLPGVARAFGGQIIVRGSGPQDTGIFVDGSTVPLIFHFGALKSVLPAAIIEGVDFFPGNYSVRFGRRTGGIYDLHVKRLDPDRVHGSIDVSILDTSIYVEAPIGDKAAIAVGGRRSYIDYVLETVIPDDAGFNLTTAPRYYDFQVLGNYRPNRKHEIRWLALASDDLFEILFDDAADTVGPGAQGNDVSATTNFQRVTTDYRYTPSKDFQNRTKFSAGRDVIDFRAFGLFRLQFDVWNLELRNDSNITINDNLKLNVGLDLTSGYFDGQVNAPPIQREGEAGDEFNPDDLIFAQVDGFLFANAVYAEAEMKFGQFSMVPGLRLDYFGQVGQFTVDPRLVARYDFKPGPAGSFAIKGGAAVVHQEPEIPDLSEEFGNPDLDAFKAY